MKNFVLFAVLAACAAPSLAQSELPMDPLPAPSVDALNDAFEWKFQPEVGSRWEMRSFTRMKQIMDTPKMGDVPAQKTQVNSIARITMDYDILSRDRFGATTIRVTYRDMTSDTKVKIDGKAVDGAPGADAIQSVNGISYTMKVAPDGQVWNVQGLEQAMDKMIMAEHATDPAEREAMRQVTKTMFSSDGVKKMMQSITGAFPPHPMRVGESWPYQVELPGGLPFELKMDGTRTLKSLGGGIAAIAESLSLNIGTMEVKMPGQGTVVVDMSGLKGNSSGTTRVQVSNGLPVESLITQRMSGVVLSKLKDETGKIVQNVVLPMDVTLAMRVVMEPR